MISPRSIMNVVVKLLAITTLLASSSLPLAAAGDLDTGIALAKEGNYSKAIPLLRKGVEQSPDNPEASFYLGLALNRTAPDKEAESLLKRSLMALPENPGVNYELGLHYFEKNIHAEAVDYFEQVLELSPESELGRRSAEYLRKINERKQGKNWLVSVVAGGQYDSNVILNGRGMPLPQGYSGKSDWSAIFNLKGNYAPLKSDQAEFGVGYSFYQSLHASLQEFDIMQNLFDVSGAIALGNSVKLKGTYSFEYLLLHGRDYDTAHSLAPSLQFKSAAGTTTLDYRLRNTVFRNSRQFPTNADRNGNNHLLGVSHIYPVSDAVAVWALYSHDVDLTRKTAWDYDGNRLFSGLRSALPFGLTGEIAGEIYWKDYRGIDPQFQAGVTRHDTQYTVSLSLTKLLSETFGITLSEVWSRNNSTIAEFAYDRSITSLLLTARF